VYDTTALPDPLTGLTLTQLGAVTCQDVFEVTALVKVVTPEPGFHAGFGTDKTGAAPACVTVKKCIIVEL